MEWWWSEDTEKDVYEKDTEFLEEVSEILLNKLKLYAISASVEGKIAKFLENFFSSEFLKVPSGR